MLREYAKQTPRIIPGIHQWIQGEVRNDSDKKIRIEAFNECMDKIREGENFLNAIRDIQRKYGMPITYDTVFPYDVHELSTLVIKVG